VSPGAVAQFNRMHLDVDVSEVLPTVRVPTLILHRPGAPTIDGRVAAHMASRIANARLVELPGRNAAPPLGDQKPLFAELERFLSVGGWGIAGSQAGARDGLVHGHRRRNGNRSRIRGSALARALDRSLRSGPWKGRRASRPHRCARRGKSLGPRGTRFQHRQGSRGRLGDRVQRPRNARTDGRPRRVAPLLDRSLNRLTGPPSGDIGDHWPKGGCCRPVRGAERRGGARPLLR